MKYLNTVFAILCVSIAIAQVPEEPEILSPNSASIGSFGDVPVNHFVGSPNINIPLYTIAVGNISVPVSLSYNKELVKPANIPGWAGLGWNLNCGGVITRKVNGRPDEFIHNYDPDIKGFIEAGKAYLDNIEQSGRNPYGADSMEAYYKNLGKIGIGLTVDLEADEFSFNIPGHSGRIFYKNDVDGWIAFSDDENIKVELIGYVYDGGADDLEVIDYKPQYDATMPHRAFTGFRLILANGTTYTFGGKLSAMEFSNDYVSNIDSYYAENCIFNTWYLTKIEDIDGNTVTFSYKPGDPICKVAHSLHQVIYGSFIYNWGNCLGSGSGFEDFYDGIEAEEEIDYCNKQGRVIFPVYLKQVQAKVKNNDGTFTTYSDVSFDSDAANSLTYTDNYLNRNSMYDSPHSDFFLHSWIGSPATFKWYQLNNITITENSDRETKYEFSYEPPTGNIEDQKLTLYSIQKYNKDLSTSFTETEQYSFEYNPLGYTDYDALGENIDKYGYATTAGGNGLLTKITYPTKGYTELSWSGNRYYKYVAKDRKNLVTIPSGEYSLTAGYRIKSVKHKDIDGNLLKNLTYVYEDVSGNSSGILNGDPTDAYKFDVSLRYPTDFYANYAVQISFIVKDANGMTNYSNNGQSHIGYSRVVETDETANVERIYTYTNFGSYAESGGSPYYDRSINSYIGWKAGEDQYMEMTPIGSLLGKLQKVEEEFGSYTKTTVYHYHEFESNQQSYKRIKRNNSYDFKINYRPECCSDQEHPEVCDLDYIPFRVTFATVLAERRLRSKLSLKNVMFTSGETQRKIQTFYYNLDGLLFKEITELDDNEYYFKYYSYPPDGAAVFDGQEPTYWSNLRNKYDDHILSEPYLTKTIYAKNGNTEVIDANYLEFDNSYPYHANTLYTLNEEGLDILGWDIDFEYPYFPETDLDYYLDNENLKQEATFKYDDAGNLIMIKPKSGLMTYYLWGYDKKIPLAKIIAGEELMITDDLRDQVINMSNADRRTLITSTLGDGDYMLYTYRSSIPEGLVSETGPNGIVTHYEYDFAGRLKNIMDDNEDLLKEFKYHYADPSGN